MLDGIKKLLGLGSKVDYAELMGQGAVIVDVRTKGEYQGGHIDGSVNIPLQTIEHSLGRIKKDKPVITCCASGMRSGSARKILLNKGYSEVYNGGGWMSLQQKIK